MIISKCGGRNPDVGDNIQVSQVIFKCRRNISRRARIISKRIKTISECRGQYSHVKRQHPGVGRRYPSVGRQYPSRRGHHYKCGRMPTRCRTALAQGIRSVVLIVSIAAAYVFMQTTNKFVWRVVEVTNETLSTQEDAACLSRRQNWCRGRGKSLPHVIVAGVKKCGTGALIDFLEMHTDVMVSKYHGTREAHFFDKEENYEKGLEWYRETFMPETSPGQITIEKTPKYFVTEKAPERIHNMNSSIKLLFVMREPIYRTVSDYLHERKFHPETRMEKTFEKFAINQSTGELNEAHEEIQTSIYHKHFQRWLKYFDRSQIHIVDGESLARNPVSELVKVERFLGLAHQFNSKRFFYDEKKGYYCKKTAKGKLCLPPGKGRKHPNVQQQVLDKLCQYFRPHNEILFQMTGERYDWRC